MNDIDAFELGLTQKQLKQAKLIRLAYGKIVLWRNKGKMRLLNPDEVSVFEFQK